jgi:hypothetical protein
MSALRPIAAPNRMRAAAAAGLPGGIRVNVTGHDPLEEASAHGSSGSSSVLASWLELAGRGIPRDRRIRRGDPGDHRSRQRHPEGTNGTLTGVAAVDRDFLHVLVRQLPCRRHGPALGR